MEEMLKRHVEVVGHYVKHVLKFGVDGYQTKFVLKNLDEADNPVRVLERVMDRLMETATTNATEADFEVTDIGVAFRVDGMTEDFLVPFRPPEENNAEKVSQAIDDYDQSEKDGEPVSIYDKEMDLRITLVKRPLGAGRCPFVDDEADCSEEDSDREEEYDEDEDEESEDVFLEREMEEQGVSIRRRNTDEATGDAAGLTELAKPARKRRQGRNKLQYVPGLSIVENALIRMPKFDTHCLFYAIIVAQRYSLLMKRDVPNRAQIAYHQTQRLSKNHQRLRDEAGDLMWAAGIQTGHHAYGLDDAMKVQDYFNRSWQGLFRLVIFGERSGHKTLFNGGVNAKNNLYLYHNNGHYDVMKSPAQFFDRKYYCVDCEAPFANVEGHTIHCRIKCAYCLRMGHKKPCQPDGVTFEYCANCKRTFYNRLCFEEHKKMACRYIHYCHNCEKAYRVSNAKARGGHICHERWCQTCKRHHLSHEPCYIPTLKIGEGTPYRIASYDFEAEIHRKVAVNKKEHEPNYVSVHVTCTECIAKGTWENFEQTDCKICGPKKHWKFGAWELPEGRTVVDALLELLLNNLPKGYPVYAYAHNAAKYDVHFTLKGICKRRGIRPKITSVGNKIMELRVAKTKNFNKVIFRDSLLLFPMKLDDCPKTFDLRRNGRLLEGKTRFPYAYNRAENYGVRRECLPPPEDYLLAKMSKEEKKSFMEWYEAHRSDPFDLCETLAEYCSNDTLILIYALVNFRQTFNKVAGGSDIFVRCCTVTGGCIRLFRHRFLKEKSLAVVPNNGYLGGDIQSGKALKFIKWYADKHNVKIQHRDTDEGEYRTLNTPVYSCRLDGYIPLAERFKPDFRPCGQPGCPYCDDPESLQKDIALEFHGCAWHGCPDCFPNEARLPNGKKSDAAFADTLKRTEAIEKSGLKVIQVWEHALDKELKENKDLKKWFDNEHDTGALDPRDAFFGGRVHPTRMISEPSPHTRKKHCDIVSLYPSVLRKPFPVGHPDVHHFDWAEGEVLWERDDQVEYKGLIKCIVRPPKALFLPLLPFRDDQRLLFPLCRTCAIESRKESCYGLKQCRHTEEQREFVTTATHFELEEALRRGYKVTRLIEFWHYKSLDDSIFRDYINEFMKIKAPSGWENVGIDPRDEDAKERFRVEYALREGILIDKDNVRLNKGMRYIAKLCLNSLWGRFAMRSNREQVEIVTSPSRLYELLDSPSKEVIKIIDMDEDTLRVSWRYKNRFERTDENSNLVVAIFTTAYGRCELYKHMCAVEEKMDGPPGSKLLYNDTDSVVYEYVPDSSLPNGGNPLEEGIYLGEMTDEYKDADILEFLSGGNKQYGVQYQKRDSGQIGYTLKIRGITLTNERNRRLLSYEKFREMICAQPLVMPLSLPNDLIVRDNRSNT